MARGRDAVDVAMTTSFGPTTLEKFVVTTQEMTEPWVPGNARQRLDLLSMAPRS
jgi:hypothetical protein